MRFDDQVAVITGGRGLDMQYALLLASRGARVLVNDSATVTASGSDADAAAAAADRSVGSAARPSPTATA